MANIKLSAMSPLPAVNATYTYGITGSSTEGKIPLNASGGLPIYNVTVLVPYADDACSLGNSAARWDSLTMSLSATVTFDDGTGSVNSIGYVDGTGPTFNDRTHSGQLAFSISTLTAARLVTWPNNSGTVTLLGNTTTGTGSIVLATAPTFPTTVAVTGKVLTTGGLGVGNSASATLPGTVIKKIQVFDASGASLGYIAVYDAIT